LSSKGQGYLKIYEAECGHWKVETVLVTDGVEKSATCRTCFDNEEDAIKAGKEFVEAMVKNPRYDSPSSLQ
jgi:hypothetical protein